jgi:hypothetical protein
MQPNTTVPVSNAAINMFGALYATPPPNDDFDDEGGGKSLFEDRNTKNIFFKNKMIDFLCIAISNDV